MGNNIVSNKLRTISYFLIFKTYIKLTSLLTRHLCMKAVCDLIVKFPKQKSAKSTRIKSLGVGSIDKYPKLIVKILYC